MNKLLSFLYKNAKNALIHNKIIVILFFVWLYRVDFIPADGGGIAKALQVVCIFGLLLIVYRKNHNIIGNTYLRSNGPVKSILILYTYALISTLWAFIPIFAFFLSFQMIILCLLLFWVFSQIHDFKTMEKVFITICYSIILFEAIFHRVLFVPSLFIHELTSASSAAMLFSYCLAEYLNMKIHDSERSSYLKFTMLFSVCILITSTSSGANASAILGMIISLFFSGNIIYAFGLIIIALFLYFNQDLITKLLFFIMPGKDMTAIESATGRTELWETMMNLADQKPLFGWGFACIERAATAFGDKASPDAHNNYIGIYGSLGYVGIILLIYHYCTNVIYLLKRRSRIGCLGLLAAASCSMLNGYSYGFLSGKACSITVIYFMIVVLSFYYSRVKYYGR